jgi:hypothetical protein
MKPYPDTKHRRDQVFSENNEERPSIAKSHTLVLRVYAGFETSASLWIIFLRRG